MLNAKKGISACQVARDLGIRRPTVWAIMHKIRGAMKTEQKELLEGIFEMDETYIKSKNDDKDDNDLNGTGRRENNTSVVGIKQRGGVIKAFATHNTTTTTLLNIALNIAKQGSEIQTDEYNAYTKFSEYYKHKKVKHALEYVTADGIHCNGVESFWALLKRGIKGQFHHLSKKYLQNYIDEFEFRYNMKNKQDLGMSEVVGRMLGL
jgi:transposase-like protein